jgi:hypothetical protein
VAAINREPSEVKARTLTATFMAQCFSYALGGVGRPNRYRSIFGSDREQRVLLTESDSGRVDCERFPHCFTRRAPKLDRADRRSGDDSLVERAEHFINLTLVKHRLPELFTCLQTPDASGMIVKPSRYQASSGRVKSNCQGLRLHAGAGDLALMIEHLEQAIAPCAPGREIDRNGLLEGLTRWRAVSQRSDKPMKPLVDSPSFSQGLGLTQILLSQSLANA